MGKQKFDITDLRRTIQESNPATLLVIIVFLLAIIVVWLVVSALAEKYSANQLQEKMRITSARMDHIQFLINLEKSYSGTCPRSIRDLKRSDDTAIEDNDAWGSRIVYSTDGYHYSLTSPGPDKTIGTFDDIVLRDR